MKNSIIIMATIALCLSLSACDSAIDKGILVGEITNEVIVRDGGQATQEKFFEVRVTDTGFDPDTIIVNKGDHVTIHAVNLRREIQEDAHNMFYVYPFYIEEIHERGNGLVAEFVATESGDFTFGDDRSPNRLGRLIVN